MLTNTHASSMIYIIKLKVCIAQAPIVDTMIFAVKKTKHFLLTQQKFHQGLFIFHFYRTHLKIDFNFR
jgi:hypothetical protein